MSLLRALSRPSTPTASKSTSPIKPTLPAMLALRWATAATLAGVACATLLAGFEAWPVAPLDRAWADALVAHVRPAAPADVVVIDVDDDSLAAVGQWPWPRYRLAELIDHAAAAKPAAIALDVLFTDADRTSLADMQARLHRDFDLDVSIGGVPRGLLDNDGYLGHTLERTGAIAGAYFFFDHASPGARAPAHGVTFTGRRDLIEPDVATGVLEDAPGIAARPHASGFLNCLPDPDGVLRRLPLVVAHQGTWYPSLALAAAARAVGASTIVVEAGRDGPVLRVGVERIAVDARGRAWLAFPGNGWQTTVSAVDVLAGRVDQARLRGKTVFVGTSVVGLNDIVRTAIDARLPGVQSHAAMAQALLAGTSVTVPRWGLAVEAGAAAVAAFLLLTLHRRRRSTRTLVVTASVLAPVWVLGGLALFTTLGCIVAPTVPIIVGGLACATLVGARQVALRRRAFAWKAQLDNERQVTIESMAAVAETRDPETGAHIKRTQYYVQAIARQLQREGRDPETLTDEYIHLLFLSAPLHDVGKVGVPDHILLKPGKLDTSEMTQMKRHAEFGRQIIMSTSRRIEGDNYLVIAGEIAATHHEKWDGTGYPLGLAGTRIPLSGRIMAAADIYDALISRRCYKEPFTHAHATHLMRVQRGTTFDPVVLDAFFAIEDEIQDIAARFQDHEGPEDELALATASTEGTAPGVPVAAHAA